MLNETGARTAQPHSSSLSQLASLLKRFFDQFGNLFDTQVALFKAELKEAVRIYARPLFLAVTSVLVTLIGFSLLSLGLGLVFWVNGHIHNLAISFGCVGGAYLTIGALSTLGTNSSARNHEEKAFCTLDFSSSQESS